MPFIPPLRRHGPADLCEFKANLIQSKPRAARACYTEKLCLKTKQNNTKKKKRPKQNQPTKTTTKPNQTKNRPSPNQTNTQKRKTGQKKNVDNCLLLPLKIREKNSACTLSIL